MVPVGLSEAYFNLIPEIYPDNFNWSEGYSPFYDNWLANFAKEYYNRMNLDVINGSLESGELQLQDEDIYRPENCIGES